MELRKNKEFLKRLYDLRKEGKNYEEISVELERDFGNKYHKETLKKYYEEYITNSYVIVSQLKENKQEAIGVVKDHSERIKIKFAQVDRIVTVLLRKIERMMGTMEDETFIKQVPTLLAVCREILSQLYFLKKEQEQLVINQKNIIYSPLQINQLINKELNNLENYKESNKLFIKEGTKKKFNELTRELIKKNKLPNGALTQDKIINLLIEAYKK